MSFWSTFFVLPFYEKLAFRICNFFIYQIFVFSLIFLLYKAHHKAGRQRSKDLLQRWGGGAGGVLHLHPQPRGHAGGGGGRRARGLSHLPRPWPEETALQVSSSNNETTIFYIPWGSKSQSTDWYRETTELVQYSADRGSSHRHNTDGTICRLPIP